ncbi:MAG TPA: hypothetical protein VLV86_25320 [Vicinamibacterales bacterium]|nr:hypothetical protein [Vicinamibacterales bacterium]
MNPTVTARGPAPLVRTELRHDMLLRRIRSEYREMPGHALSLRQAQRMWNLPFVECEGLLHELVDAGFLSCTKIGLFVRADAGRAGA